MKDFKLGTRVQMVASFGGALGVMARAGWTFLFSLSLDGVCGWAYWMDGWMNALLAIHSLVETVKSNWFSLSEDGW